LIKKDDTLLNGAVRFPEVRCVGDDGEQFGIISSKEAYDLAQEKGFDLVCIAPTATPPVCKIMDYNKFKYQQEKKLKEARKKQVIVDVKEIKLSIKIAQHDMDYKVKHAREFLEAKKHVKFKVFLSGREMSNPQMGVNILNNVYEIVKDIGDKDKEPILEGRYVNMMVLPKKSTKPAPKQDKDEGSKE
jgi:translation initiation factor IF-3